MLGGMLGEGHARLRHQAGGADEVGAGVEDVVHRLQQAEQQEGHDHRQQRQDRAGLLAEQVGKTGPVLVMG